MNEYTAIGIDPDVRGFECNRVCSSTGKNERSYFESTNKGISNFIAWAATFKNVVIAIEGRNGQNRQLEGSLHNANIPFYSFSPNQVESFRKAYFGEHKTNAIDAEATARFALSLQDQGKLCKYERKWFPDNELRDLTRMYGVESKQLTVVYNRLWKSVRKASVEVYGALGGGGKKALEPGLLGQKGTLLLLKEKPDLSTWCNCSTDEILEIIGNHGSENRVSLIDSLQTASKYTSPVPHSLQVIISGTASQALLTKSQKYLFTKEMERASEDNLSVKLLLEEKGIGIITAATIIAEIIDINRFPTNNHLASYCGLGRKQHSTGTNHRERKGIHYNRRLKNAFMTAAKNYVRFNPTSHLAGYFRNLITKREMTIIEARKRVARALVRYFYRILKELFFKETEVVIHEKADGEINSSESNNSRTTTTTISSVTLEKKKSNRLAKPSLKKKKKCG